MKRTVDQVSRVDEDRSIDLARDEAPELEPAVGEDLDDDWSRLAEASDHTEPTEKQKRELLKIHRGLGHPQPNELGRALRNAGVKRHLIRWATHELRCPVCESRVKPLARRPATLPRTLKFNQVVGVDAWREVPPIWLAGGLGGKGSRRRAGAPPCRGRGP